MLTADCTVLPTDADPMAKERQDSVPRYAILDNARQMDTPFIEWRMTGKAVAYYALPYVEAYPTFQIFAKAFYNGN